MAHGSKTLLLDDTYFKVNCGIGGSARCFADRQEKVVTLELDLQEWRCQAHGMKQRLGAYICAVLVLGSAAGSDLRLWYQHAAKTAMTEALPIGNGRLGGLVFGGTEKERLVINESSLWTGDENPSGNYDTMGAYQVLGNVFITLPGHTDAQSYRRNLDIGEALAHVTYEVQGVTYQREFFCSQPSGLVVARFTASKPGQYSGTLEAKDGHGASGLSSGDRLLLKGTLKNGLQYEWQVALVADGGELHSTGEGLSFKRCNSFTVLIAGRTDYAMDDTAHYRGPNPHARVAGEIAANLQTSFDQLKMDHVRDFQSVFNRVRLDLGQSSAAQRRLPTNERKRSAFGSVDPELEELLFQYGRYLLISCSRPGGLPANLQGLWNDSNDPPWHSDYHANINVQMNYWPAEVANLSECHLPFLDLVRSQLPAWRNAAASTEDLNCPSGARTTRGFAIRTSHNTMGGLGWKWDKTANAWYCQHFWEHYAFGMDSQYLREEAYPVLKETCQYWEDHLKQLPDGRWVAPNAWSPEHGPDEDGVSYSQEIIWDLFNNYVHACDILKLDQSYRDKIAGLRDNLVTPGVGSWGQLLEWMTEKKGTNAVPGSPELDTPNDHHRHTSHLFAIYPGSQFMADKNKALAAAAKVSLDARGIAPDSDVREWSLAWRSALYARLHDSERAHRMLQQLFSERNTCPNLFGLHPPMQMDGNFGITAGICEMLVQSQSGELEILPALPSAWPSGSFKGLRARGGLTLDATWKDGRLSRATLHSTIAQECRIRYGTKVINVAIGSGESKQLDANLWAK